MVENHEPQKIAFVGTSCVGKTTLVDSLRTQFKKDPRVAFVGEAARAYFSTHPGIPEEQRFSALHQGNIQNIQFGMELDARNNGASTIICDRSVLDAVVYASAHGDEGSEELYLAYKFWVPSYSRIYLLDPKDVPYEQDDIRIESEETRLKNHEEFLKTFSQLKIPYELLSGTVKERLARIDKVLNGNLEFRTPSP